MHFADKKPVRVTKLKSNHEGAIYHFASAEHKALFDAVLETLPATVVTAVTPREH